MKTLLVPIDYSEDSLKALEVALLLAVRTDAQLLLCHVYQPPVLVADETEPEFSLPAYETRSEALGRLRKFVNLVKKNAPQAVPVTFTAKAGDVVTELLTLTRTRDISMVVMGTEGAPSFLTKLIGTTTEELVQQAPCPVLIVPLRAEVHSFSHIVYASALEPSEADALQVLAQVQKLFHATLTLLYVNRDGEMGDINIAVRKNYLLHDYTGEEVEYKLIQSKDVAEGIAHFAQDSHCDLVAFTVSEHSVWHNPFHQHVTNHLLQELNVPMLALPKHGKAIDLVHSSKAASLKK